MEILSGMTISKDHRVIRKDIHMDSGEERLISDLIPNSETVNLITFIFYDNFDVSIQVGVDSDMRPKNLITYVERIKKFERA
jgi:hypothetical protein